MKFYRKWLEEDSRALADALKNIPTESRKGYEVGMLRKRAREVGTCLELLAEFEALRDRVV